ncbi:MAG TPA: hypothetical protein VFY79_07415 [Dehalococcoidia bacterium]|nr:hypothetical protein [Dehalococcoidia bacterium]
MSIVLAGTPSPRPGLPSTGGGEPHRGGAIGGMLLALFVAIGLGATAYGLRLRKMR